MSNDQVKRALGTTSRNLAHHIVGFVASFLFLGFCLLIPQRALGQASCCVVRGNADCSPDGVVDVGDLTIMVENLFITYAPLCCPEAANTDASPDGSVDISDLNLLIEYLFITFDGFVPCGGEISIENRTQAINAIDSVVKAGFAKAPDSLAKTLLTFLKTLPVIDSAGIFDSLSVWAEFTDGRLLVIPNNRQPSSSVVNTGEMPEPQYELAPPPGFTQPKRRIPELTDGALNNASPDAAPTTPGTNFDLPSSLQARLISNLSPTCWDQSVPMIKNLLEKGGYNCNVVSGTVTNLLNVSDDGVFYIDTHGGAGQDMQLNDYHALWTNSVFSDANDVAFANMLRHHELVYMVAYDYDPDSNQCDSHCRYAITGKFVAQYMYFAPNSLIFINACMGDSVPALRNGFFTAGASEFCGFTRSVSAPGSNRAAEFLFDRMLGTNASTLFPKENPPQRPFDIDKVYQDMVTRHVDTDPNLVHAKMRVHRLQNHFGILAPSLRYMAVVEHFDTLYVTGIFGTDPGASHRRVMVGGTDMLVYTWEPELITCFIPNTGAGSIGPVTVEIDGITGPTVATKRKSNVVNLTSWEGDFTYKEQNIGTLEKKIVISAKLRADIHAFRDFPNQTPHYYSVYFPAMESSFGVASVSGTATQQDPGSDPATFTTWNWYGSHPTKGLFENDPTGFLIVGYVDGNAHTFKLRIVAAEGRGLHEDVITQNDTTRYDLFAQIPYEMYDEIPTSFKIPMNNVWDILSGGRGMLTCCSYDYDNVVSDPDELNLFNWPTIQAAWAPDPQAGQ